MFQWWNAVAPGNWVNEWLHRWVVRFRQCLRWEVFKRFTMMASRPLSYISALGLSLQPHSHAASPYRGKMAFRSSWVASSPSHSRARKRVSFTCDCIKITGSNRVTYPLRSQSLGPGKYHCSDWPARLGGWMGSTLNWEQRGVAPVEKQTRRSVLRYG